jgi:hypothetical protein
MIELGKTLTLWLTLPIVVMMVIVWVCYGKRVR